MAQNLDELEFKTPMMRQYLEIKKKHKDALLLFRLGDFYELFLADAKIAAEILGIALTKRSRGRDGDIPMCGIPYHALETYLGKLIKTGNKVAICEQMQDAGQTSGMVERKVVRVVTPGTVLNDKNLEQKENNYLLGLEFNNKYLGLAYVDLSTGEIYIHQTPYQDLEKKLASQLQQIKPTEIVSSHQNYNNPKILRGLRLVSDTNIFPFDHWEKNSQNFEKHLKEHFQVQTFDGFGLSKDKHGLGLKAASGLLGYLKETQQSSLNHLKKLTPFWSKDFLRLDSMTITNLELFTTIRGQKGGTLIEVLDQTRTAAGGRKLRQWLLKPLNHQKKINRRLDAVEILKQKRRQRQEIEDLLSQVLDIERLISRISVGTANPRDLEALKVSLINIEKIKRFLDNDLENLSYLLPNQLVEENKPLVKLLDNSIKKDPPAGLSDGGYIADGVSEQLDEYRQTLKGSKSWLKQFQQQEREKTGINTLKVSKNKVFGFYIEVSKSQISKVPDHYIRKQTLVNSERYILPELKQKEETALQAEENVKQIEKQIFEKLLNQIMDYAQPAQEIAGQTAKLDVYTSLAVIAEKNRYTRPEISTKGSLKIKNGRHPVIEQMQDNQSFIPNNVELNKKHRQVLLITGPNMAGKSTYLRQTALITLLAQMGSFVPADKAAIPLRDQIYTRVGASDNLVRGQSTFLVEMSETARILNNCTDKSLIIFDEIGRGTSTFDGMSIAWAVIEYLVEHKNKKAFTLFATHYHELTALAKKFPGVENMQMAIDQDKDSIIFLYKVKPGRAWQSYGVEVAELAGLPDQVTRRAQQILRQVKKNQKQISLASSAEKSDDSKQTKLSFDN